MHSEITLHCVEPNAIRLAVGIAEEVCRWVDLEPDEALGEIERTWPRVSLGKVNGKPVNLLMEYEGTKLWVARLWDVSFKRRINRRIDEILSA